MTRFGVEIEGLSKDMGEFQIKDISFRVPRAEYFMVLGPTGAGKTILLETIAGIYHPDKGEIKLHGKETEGIPPEDRNIGFVYQDYALFPHLNVYDNVAFGLRARKEAGIEDKTEEAIDLLDLNPLKTRYPRTLSGGEKQKTAVARAVAYEPGLLLLDEPTAALDPRSKEEVRNELQKLHEKLEITTLHVTHNQAEAKILGDKIAVLMDGSLKQAGSVSDIFNRPVDDSVANFVGVENVLRGRIISSEEGVATVDTGKLQLKVVTERKEGEVKIYVRPEDIFISDSRQRTSARNIIPGEVVSITPLEQVFRVLFDNGLTCFVTKQSREEFELKKGKRVFSYIKASAPEVR